MLHISSQSKTALIVDDDLTNRLVLRALLKEAGYQSIEVENGEQAVQAVEDNPQIDIVLLDVMMPVMDGYQAAQIIKKRSKSFVPIIFLTAMTDEASLARCIEAGGDDFLTKPYNHVLLNSKINSMLRIASLYKNIEDQNKSMQNHNLQMLQEMNVTRKLFEKINKNDMRGENTGLKYSMSPMSMFNGDLILAEKNQTSGLDMLVADFTGHGLSAAIGAIPVADVFHSMTKKCFAFPEMLVEANNKLLDLLPTEMFMAVVLLNVDRSNNVISVMNAGLPDVYLYRKNKIVHTFKAKNIPLGISKLSTTQFEVEMQPLQYGDRIYVATDGVMEATNHAGEMFGLQRLRAVFDETGNSETLFDLILRKCTDFCEGSEQTDDITLLEFCHKETVSYTGDVVYKNASREPSNWSMQFDLDIKSLRQFDVLPYIMQAVNNLQPLHSGRTHLHTILTEMFANAIDHGLLRLDSSMKNSPQGYMDFYREKQHRLETMQEGSIQISLEHRINNDSRGGSLRLTVIDSGDGYAYVSESSSMRHKNAYSGRGLKLVSSLCTEMKILGKGNVISARYDWSNAKAD